MPLIRFVKDPDAVLDYVLDWSKWLTAGDNITAVTADPDTGITVDSTEFTDSTTTIWLSGGTAGTTYSIVVHVTTSDAREDDRTVKIEVKER